MAKIPKTTPEEHQRVLDNAERLREFARRTMRERERREAEEQTKKG